MHRRSVLRSILIGAVSVAGCLGDDGGFGAENESGGEEEPDDGDPAGMEHVTESFGSRGFDVLDATQDADTIVLEIQTTGDADEDVRVAAGAYATVARQIERDLLVHVEDRGLRQETFEIELEWARLFLDERISDQEYIERIEGTRR